MKPFLLRLPRPTLIAHRGGAATAPENTLVAFRTAIEQHGVDQLELDVRLSRDGVPMVIHDADLNRTTEATGPVGGLTCAELGQLDAGHRYTRDDGRTFPFRGRGVRIPTLDDVLTTFAHPIIMELKSATADCRRAVIDLVRRRGAVDRICLGAVSDDDAAALADELPEACRFFPAAAAQRFLSDALGGRDPASVPFDVLALPYEAVLPSAALLLAAAHAREAIIQVWTVNDTPTMQRCLQLGIDGIMTDRPDELRRVMAADDA